MLPRPAPLFFCSEWAGEICEAIGHYLIGPYRNAPFNFTRQRATLLASLASRFAGLRCGWRENCQHVRGRKYIETCAGNHRGWIDAAAPGTSDAAPFGAGQRWQHGNAGHGYPCRHLQRPSYLYDGNVAARPRHRWKWLAVPRPNGSLAMASVQSTCQRGENLGSRQKTRSRFHMRQHVLVVQYGLES